MATLLFVHGTGVRGPAFDASFRLVKAQAAEHVPQLDVQACLWGDALGATRADDAAAVPGQQRGRTPAPDAGRDRRASELRWALLYEDPLYELRTHAALAALHGDEDELDAGDAAADPAAARLLEPLRHLTPSRGGIARAGHLAVELMPRALEALLADDVLHRALRAPALQETVRGRPLLARAVVAAWMAVAAERGLPALDGELRDSLVQDVVAGLGGATMALKDELLGVLGGLAARAATPLLRWKRDAITEATFAPIQDILLYQTPHGGRAIRGAIRTHIAACAPPVFVLAHSLGGIASVELLALPGPGAGTPAADGDPPAPPAVQGLITCGSQAPFLYEADSLATLRRGTPLPPHFPRWLNVFDLNDLLSYATAGVFVDARVADHEVRSGQPFPHSHSAYWSQDALWQRVKAFAK